LDIQTQAIAKGRLPRSKTARKIAGSIWNGIGRNAQKIPMEIPFAVV